MTLDHANWYELAPILKETFKIWSAGLSKEAYKHYLWRQMHHPWGRKHLRYLVFRQNNVIAGSCKAYSLTMYHRNKFLTVLGLGAVFTLAKFRQQGIAHKMIKAVIEHYQKISYDAVLLFSDIGTEYYERLGFEPMSAYNFVFALPEKQMGQRDINLVEIELNRMPTINSELTTKLDSGLSPSLLENMVTCYEKWLARRPYGVSRSESYLHFKLARESFLTSNSQLNWPSLTIWLLPDSPKEFAYALTESSGKIMRILEVVGKESSRLTLWSGLCEKLKHTHITHIRGWESVMEDFAPNFTFNATWTPWSSSDQNLNKIHWAERGWGMPMLFPLTNSFAQDFKQWNNYFPCPFLELDHL